MDFDLRVAARMVWCLWKFIHHVTCMQRPLATSCLCFFLITSPWCCLADTEEYTMPGDICGKFLHDKEGVWLRGVGDRLWSSEVCEVTIQAANNARWMLLVQTAVIMDCKVRITVYDTNFAAKPTIPVAMIGCASRDPGVIRVSTPLLKIRLYHKNESDYNFNILMTSRDVSSQAKCQGFHCHSGDCIPKSLMCDSVDNCFDNSDESSNGTSYCDYYWPFKGENWYVLGSVLGVGLVLGVTAACCRQFRKRRDSLDELYDLTEHPSAKIKGHPYAQRYAFQYRVIRPPSHHSSLATVSHSCGHGHAHSSHNHCSHNQGHHDHGSGHHHSRHDGDRDRGKVG